MKHLTVNELIRKLELMPQDLPVCMDCGDFVGDAGDVEVQEFGGDKCVYILNTESR